MAFIQVHSPRQPGAITDFQQESAENGITIVPDRRLLLKYTKQRNILPRLSASLDNLLQTNNHKQNTPSNPDEHIDVVAALGIVPVVGNDTKPEVATQLSVPRRQRVINYGASKKDLTRGIGTKLRGPGGSKMRLDQYSGKVRRRRHYISQLRGHTLGNILAETQDRSKFLVLRDFQMPEIIARWQRYFLRAVLRTWRRLVELAKEDMLRYRKMFVKSDRELMKRALKILRHEADLAMAQRANSQLNNHSRADDEKNQRLREYKTKAKVSRAKIISLELQNDSLVEERNELRAEVAKWMGLAKGKKGNEGGGGGGGASAAASAAASGASGDSGAACSGDSV